MTDRDYDSSTTPDDEALDSNGSESEDFASLLDGYMTDSISDIRLGDKISTNIIAIGKDSVFLNTGGKSDGVADKAELLDGNGEFPYQVGDRLDLYVIDTRDGEIRLSRAMSTSGGPDFLYQAREDKIPVTGKVTETCKGGFRVQVMGHNAFCPVSQMDIQYVEQPESFVGASLDFLIERIESGGRNLVVNRRRLLERLQAEEREKFLAEVNPGDIVAGTVTRIMPFGAFIELHTGVEGMAHISELSWSRVADPAEAVRIGEALSVKILSIEKTGSKSGGLKIALSVKQAAGDPWKNIGEKYRAGDKIEGRVTRCADFGVFVEVEPGVEGLVHISEISRTRRVVRPEDEVKPGETVAVLVTSVDPVNRRLSLSIKGAEGDLWLTIDNQLAVDQVVSGTIERKLDFGCFVTLLPGITGLLPRSSIERGLGPQAMEKMKIDEPVSVRIEALDIANRKITLAPADAEGASDWKTFSRDSTTGSSGLGDLGRKLQEAMKPKQ